MLLAVLPSDFLSFQQFTTLASLQLSLTLVPVRCKVDWFTAWLVFQQPDVYFAEMSQVWLGILSSSLSILYGYSFFFLPFPWVSHKSFVGVGSSNFLLVRASLLAGAPPLTGLVLLLASSTLACAVDQAISNSVLLDFVMGQEWQLLGSLDIWNLLRIALGKDDVNLLQRSVCGLWMRLLARLRWCFWQTGELHTSG